MRTPNLNTLKMFDASARHLNFRLAAEELSLTQGAVAQQVRKLEADLNVKLFHRVARGLVLTELGSRYHHSIRHALAIVDEATQALYPEHIRITLSVSPSLASKWLVPKLAQFSEIHPEIDIQVIATESLADFQSDGVDIAIRQGVPPFGTGLLTQQLAPLQLCAVCSPTYAKQVEVIEGVENFSGYQLIQDGHMLWQTLFDDAGIPLNVRINQFNQTALAMDAAQNGQGIALVPLLLAARAIEQGELVNLWRDEHADPSGYYIVYPDADRTDRSHMKAVASWLLNQVGN